MIVILFDFLVCLFLEIEFLVFLTGSAKKTVQTREQKQNDIVSNGLIALFLPFVSRAHRQNLRFYLYLQLKPIRVLFLRVISFGMSLSISQAWFFLRYVLIVVVAHRIFFFGALFILCLFLCFRLVSVRMFKNVQIYFSAYGILVSLVPKLTLREELSKWETNTDCLFMFHAEISMHGTFTATTTKRNDIEEY